MVIDISLLKIQCKLLCGNSYSPDLFEEMTSHPAFKTFLYHEEMLDRNTTVESVRSAFQNVINGHRDVTHLKLDACKDRAAELVEFAEEMKREQNPYVSTVMNRLSSFTACPVPADTVVYLYALGNDGGFCLHDGELFINLLRARQDWINILCHELYHSRELSDRTIEKRIRYISLTEETDSAGDAFLSELVEEGIATLIQYEGNYVFPPEEVTQALTQLNRWPSLSQEERTNLRQKCATGKLRYQAAYSLAKAVYDTDGIPGLESWSRDADLAAFKNALQSLSACAIQ